MPPGPVWSPCVGVVTPHVRGVKPVNDLLDYAESRSARYFRLSG
jgi:hypothetical protein